MTRLTNEEFVDCIAEIKAGGKIPRGLEENDEANLQLASRFLYYRNKSPMEIFGTFSQSTELGDIMHALDRLPPVEKRIIYTFLASGYPIHVVAKMTFRSVHHSINSLRSGLAGIRKIIASDLARGRVNRPHYSI